MEIKSFEEFNESNGFSRFDAKQSSTWLIKDKNHSLSMVLDNKMNTIEITIGSYDTKSSMKEPKTQIEIYSYKDITYDDMKAVKEKMEFVGTDYFNTFVYRKFYNQTKDINQDIDILNSLSLEYFSKKVDNKTKDKIIEHYHNGEYKNIKSIIKDYREQVLELEAEFDKTNSKTSSSVFDNLWSRALLIGDVIMESYPTMYDEICIKSGLNRTTDLFSKYAVEGNKLQESSSKEEDIEEIISNALKSLKTEDLKQNFFKRKEIILGVSIDISDLVNLAKQHKINQDDLEAYVGDNGMICCEILTKEHDNKLENDTYKRKVDNRGFKIVAKALLDNNYKRNSVRSDKLPKPIDYLKTDIKDIVKFFKVHFSK